MSEDELLGLLDSPQSETKKEDNTEDLLDLMDKGEKTEVKEGAYSKKPYVKANKIDLWNDTEIDPTKLDRSKFNPMGKYYTLIQYLPKGEVLPETVSETYYKLSKILMSNGFMLRYNGDKDTFNMKVLDIDLARVETYLPWKSFNTGITPKMVRPNEKAYHIAAYYHKKFKALPNSARAILARDVHVLLGENVDNPIKMLVCYSADGAETIADIDFKKTGYIGFSIMICDAMNIPVFNLGKKDAVPRIVEFMKSFD